MIADLPLMKNVIKPLVKSVLVPLGLIATTSATDAPIQNKFFGWDTTTLEVSKYNNLTIK